MGECRTELKAVAEEARAVTAGAVAETSEQAKGGPGLKSPGGGDGGPLWSQQCRLSNPKSNSS